jgi:hypothetical protein
MNERIKSLLAKAHLDVMEDLGDIDTNHVAEKFAELIVRECIDTILDCTVEYATRPQIAEELREHFGVK